MVKPVLETKSFTTTANDGLLNKLVNGVFVYSPTGKPPSQLDKSNEFKALWDTGATNTMITERVVRLCGLVQTGFTQLYTAGGLLEEAPTYFVDIYLPNRVKIEKVKVAQGDLRDNDLLIGMDIILLGDFAVTNLGGVTSFSFRIPSIERIDYTKPTQYIRAMPKVKRNEPCYCGSGKKYKNCHGKRK